MSGRTIAIGDIHGCPKALRALLEAIGPEPGDTLIALGDYVDRGHDSRGVIDTLMECREQCQWITLLGNHELMMMKSRDDRGFLQFWLACGGQATLTSYGGDLDAIPAGHWEWFEACRQFYETDTHFFIHANYIADLPLEQQPESSALWEHITDALPPPHVNGKTAVVGHTPQLEGEILDLGHLVCVDTFCVGGRWLTAWEASSGKIWQANKYGELRGNETDTTVGSAIDNSGPSPSEADDSESSTGASNA